MSAQPFPTCCRDCNFLSLCLVRDKVLSLLGLPLYPPLHQTAPRSLTLSLRLCPLILFPSVEAGLTNVGVSPDEKEDPTYLARPATPLAGGIPNTSVHRFPACSFLPPFISTTVAHAEPDLAAIFRACGDELDMTPFLKLLFEVSSRLQHKLFPIPLCSRGPL